jgi:energy-coupling factor transport system permease protein
VRASFRYLGRGSWLSKRDPRTKVLAAVLFAVAIVQLRDYRLLGLALIGAVAYYSLAGIPLRQVRRQWLYLVAVISFVAVVNMLFTGGRAGDFRDVEPQVLFRLPLVGWPITAEAISLSASQLLRFLGIAAVGFPIAYTIAPGELGVAFRRLGLGDRISVALDLTIRFVPTIADEFRRTLDAQRIRGYDPAARERNLIRGLRGYAALLVPVTVKSIVDAEDTIDALDLRAFGTGRRTWYRQLHFDRADWGVVGVFVAFVLSATVLNMMGRTGHQLLPFFAAG